MALRYDRKAGRFRDASGRFVSHTRGLKSSIARAQYLRVVRPKPRPRPKPVKPAPPPRRVVAPPWELPPPAVEPMLNLALYTWADLFDDLDWWGDEWEYFAEEETPS
jgi:hypothetical protein